MSCRLISARSANLRRLAAAFLFAAIALAVGLSAAPQAHEWLHKVGDRTNHECAATLMSSGSIEDSACEPASAKPQPTPSVPTFRTQLFSRVLAFLAFTRLEHAPPALS